MGTVYTGIVYLEIVYTETRATLPSGSRLARGRSGCRFSVVLFIQWSQDVVMMKHGFFNVVSFIERLRMLLFANTTAFLDRGCIVLTLRIV